MKTNNISTPHSREKERLRGIPSPPRNVFVTENIKSFYSIFVPEVKSNLAWAA